MISLTKNLLKTSIISKNFLILPNNLKLKQKTMKTFEFACKTDMITGVAFYYTLQDGVYYSGSGRTSKDEAYDIFIKISCGQPLEKTEILETINSPN